MAAIRHAGGALLRRVPAASLWRSAVDGQRPALRLLQQYPRGLHRPAAARAAFSTASTQGDISSSEPNSCIKESEEDKKNRRRMAAKMLMKSHVTDDRESEMRSINELFALLDPSNEYSYSELTELQDRRGLFEKKKNELLIALLSGDAQQEKEKMAELVAAGRLLRDAVSGRYQLHGQRRDALNLEEDVSEIKRDLKKMMDGQGKSVFEEPGAADSRALLARVLADNRDILQILDSLKESVANNKTMLESFKGQQEELKESVDNLDSSVDTLDDSVRDAMKEMKERIGTVKELVKEALEESVEETLKETIEEAVKETIESTEEMLKETIKETVKEAINETVKETVENVEETLKETIEEAVKETIESTLEESVKETIESTVADSMRDAIESTMEETVKEAIESTVEESIESMETSVDKLNESVEKLEETILRCLGSQV
ncbi:uncharacterized protein [Lolium perenne]|uniref:uncharacterized protein n=1 Tax=Lolium perenne TaxID=4522 RepID=UPI0021E9EB7A|nr:autophagy-related protein 11-like [Lolium perenne]